MNYHCRSLPWQKGCGGFLKFYEEPAGAEHDFRGRYFVCKCNKCGWESRQYSSVYCVKARIISNEQILPALTR